MSTFKERLVSLRGFTPRRLVAEATGIKEATYTAWELGRSEPGIDCLNKLAEYFGCTGDYLLGITEERGVSVTNNGDHSPVAVRNASCAECALARTIERQAAIIERLSAALPTAQPAPAKAPKARK